MKTNRKWYVLSLVITVAVCLLAVWLVGRPTRAALGNSGTPVYGRLIAPLPQSETRTLLLYAADGTPFQNNETVPAGKYLLITDIMLTPDGGTDSEAVVSVELAVKPSNQALRLRSTD